MRAVSKERDAYKIQNEELTRQMKAMFEINKSKMERDILSEEQAIDRDMATAKEDYDFAKYDAGKARSDALAKEKIKLQQFNQAPTPPEEPLDPIIQSWASRNQWIMQDPNLIQIAQGKEQELMLKNPELSKLDRINLVSELMTDQFPEKNPTPRKTFESTRNSATFGNKPKTKTFSDLPALEQRQANTLIKQGVWKNQAEFLKTYTW